MRRLLGIALVFIILLGGIWLQMHLDPTPTMAVVSTTGLDVASPIPQTATPTASPTSPPTATPTATPMPTPSPTVTLTPTPTATAISTLTPTPTAVPPTQTPVVVPPTPAPNALMWDFPFTFQTRNNCGPAVLSMVLRYYGEKIDQRTVAMAIKPNKEDKSVRFDEMAAYAESLGYRTRYLTNGDVPTIVRLVSAGIPVIVRQCLRSGSDIAHFRVVIGYRRLGEKLISDDPYNGEWYTLSRKHFYELWEAFFNEYMLIYPPEKEPLVAALVGPDWDGARMKEDALKAARHAVKQSPRDAYAWHNLGVAYFLEDRWSEAAGAFRKAVSLGLPRRFFWYQFRALWTFDRTGDYQMVLDLTTPVIKEAPSIAEVHVARGDAYMGLGKEDKAEQEYRLALEYQPTCNLAKARLFALTGRCAGKNQNHNRW